MTTFTRWMMLPRGKPGGKVKMESFHPPRTSGVLPAEAPGVEPALGASTSLLRRLLALDSPTAGVLAPELPALLVTPPAAMIGSGDSTGDPLATAMYFALLLLELAPPRKPSPTTSTGAKPARAARLLPDTGGGIGVGLGEAPPQPGASGDAEGDPCMGTGTARMPGLSLGCL